MKAVVYSFTRRGAMLSINIGEALQKFDFEVRCLTMSKFAEEKIFLEAMDDHNKACEYAFKECQLIVFVGAVGIAVRTIAPYIKNKLVDPAVLSVDEGGNFVIPLLSGHIGGANGFAKVLAKVIKATPVVTTATDVNKLFAVDEWAARNNMIINSMKAAKDFAAALVDGQEVGLFTDYPIISALPRQIVLSLLKSRQPSYPSSARSASIEGTTTVRILVGYDGEVESVIVAESSGNAALDAAAVDACYGWRFSGAKNGVGQKIRCYTYVPITFRLRSI